MCDLQYRYYQNAFIKYSKNMFGVRKYFGQTSLLSVTIPHTMPSQHTSTQTSVSTWSMSRLVAGIANFIYATMAADTILYDSW